MTTYRKKPVEIDAVKAPLNEYADNPLGDWEETPDWLQDAFDTGVITPRFAGEDYWYYDITTLEGVMTASPGDFIIRGVEGELYPCKPDIFAATYDRVSSEPEYITIPRPHVPFGPVSVPEHRADAHYLREAASHLDQGYKVSGSNLTATVIKMLRDAATALHPGDAG